MKKPNLALNKCPECGAYKLIRDELCEYCTSARSGTIVIDTIALPTAAGEDTPTPRTDALDSTVANRSIRTSTRAAGISAIGAYAKAVTLARTLERENASLRSMLSRVEELEAFKCSGLGEATQDLLRRIREARTESAQLWMDRLPITSRQFRAREESLLVELGRIYERILTEGPAVSAESSNPTKEG